MQFHANFLTMRAVVNFLVIFCLLNSCQTTSGRSRWPRRRVASGYVSVGTQKYFYGYQRRKTPPLAFPPFSPEPIDIALLMCLEMCQIVNVCDSNACNSACNTETMSNPNKPCLTCPDGQYFSFDVEMYGCAYLPKPPDYTNQPPVNPHPQHQHCNKYIHPNCNTYWPYIKYKYSKK